MDTILPASEIPKATDRFPGPKPYQENEKDIFFGRTSEVQELYESISVHEVMLVHGESGLGKSSMINAGLIPQLKIDHCLPILFRFKDRSKTPLQNILDELAPMLAAGAEELPMQIDPAFLLWYYLKRYSQANQRIVLIFDQFEEFQLFQPKDRQQLLTALAHVFARKTPEFLQDEVRQRPDTPISGAWFKPDDIRYVFSLRSDKLAVMEEIAGIMPGILRNRYQLQPIKGSYASQLIYLPTQLDMITGITFNTAPFLIEPDVISNICSVVNDTKRKSVETTQMQMICQEIELEVKKRQDKDPENKIVISNSDFPLDKLKRIVNDFYLRQLKKISESDITSEEYDAIRILIEKRMLARNTRVPQTKESLSQHFTEYLKKKKDTEIEESKVDDIINLLLNLRLIRDQPYGDTIFYEISHDTLIEGIMQERKKREEEEVQREIAAEIRQKQKEIREKNEQLIRIMEEQQKAEIERTKTNAALAVAEDERRKAEAAQKLALKAQNQAVKARDQAVKERVNGKRRTTIYIITVTFFFLASIALFLYSLNQRKEAVSLKSNFVINEAGRYFENGKYYASFRKYQEAVEDYNSEQGAHNLSRPDFAGISAIDYAPSLDGKIVLTQYRDGSGDIWDLSREKPVLLKQLLPSKTLELSANGSYVFGIGTNNQCRIINNRTRQKLPLLGNMDVDSTNEYQIFAFSPGERYFSIMDRNHILWLCDLETNQEHKLPHALVRDSAKIIFTPGDQYLIVNSRELFRLPDLGHQTLPLTSVLGFIDSTTIVGKSLTGRIVFYNFLTRQSEESGIPADAGNIRFTPDRSLLIATLFPTQAKGISQRRAARNILINLKTRKPVSLPSLFEKQFLNYTGTLFFISGQDSSDYYDVSTNKQFRLPFSLILKLSPPYLYYTEKGILLRYDMENDMVKNYGFSVKNVVETGKEIIYTDPNDKLYAYDKVSGKTTDYNRRAIIDGQVNQHYLSIFGVNDSEILQLVVLSSLKLDGKARIQYLDTFYPKLRNYN